jgi:cell division septal protein FtsQ
MKNIILLIFSLIIVFTLVSYDSYFNDQKVKEIVMIGNLNHANNKKISNTLKKLIGEKLYQVSLTDIKEELEEDPWLDTAQVIIRKPDVLVVRLIEFSPIYLWNDKVYIDKNGNKMIPRSYPIKKILKLRSNVSSSSEAHNLYQDIQDILSRINLNVVEIHQDLDLVKIKTDKYNFTVNHAVIERKLTEFTNIYDKFSSNIKNNLAPKNIDLRYPTGFAVQ